MYLIDTSVILPCLWRSTKKTYITFLGSLAEDEAPSISVVTRFEVLAGTVKEFLDANQRFLDGFGQIDITPNVADAAGRLFYDWARKGHTLSANDLFIGATAATHRSLLVTRNVKHFPYLKQREKHIVEYLSQKNRPMRDVIYFLEMLM